MFRNVRYAEIIQRKVNDIHIIRDGALNELAALGLSSCWRTRNTALVKIFSILIRVHRQYCICPLLIMIILTSELVSLHSKGSEVLTLCTNLSVKVTRTVNMLLVILA